MRSLSIVCLFIVCLFVAFVAHSARSVTLHSGKFCKCANFPFGFVDGDDGDVVFRR